MCKGSCLRIINGRLGDEWDIGKYTCISSHGCSLIDYVITKADNFARVSRFTIDSPNEWSDHCPVRFGLWCNVMLAHQVQYDDVNVKWNDNLKSEFRSLLIA